MKITVLLIALALLIAAAWAALTALETEEFARARLLECMRALPDRTAALNACPYERRWDNTRMLIAAICGTGGALVLAGALLLRPGGR